MTALDQGKAENLTKRTKELLAREPTPALIARLDVAGELKWRGAFTKDGTYLDRDTTFPIYSITKTYIATLVAKLVEQRKFSFESTLKDLLPEIPLEANTNITVRHLLRHDSGIGDYGGLPSYRTDVKNTPSMPWNEERFLNETLPYGLAFPPGKGWAYSNINYLLLKKMIEKFYGSDFPTMLAREIAAPLALHHTKVVSSPSDFSDLLPGYSEYFSSETAKESVDVRNIYHPGWVAHGLIASNTEEVNQFYNALFQSRIVSREILQEMQGAVSVPHPHPYFERPCYSLGMMCDPDFKLGPIYGHNGGGPGYAISAFILPQRMLCLIVCCNGDKASSERVLFDLLKAFCVD